MAYGMIIMFLTFLTASSCRAQGFNIEISPSTDNLTLFGGSEFTRHCVLTGFSGSAAVVRMIWERDGVQIDSIEGSFHLTLHLSSVQSVDQGHYTCRAEFMPDTQSLPGVSAGRLTVLDTSLIYAPRVQVAPVGSSTQLNCSFQGASVTWTRDGQSVENTFSSVSADDEGEYMCDVFLADLGISTQVAVMFYAVFAVEVTSMSQPVHQVLTMNQPVAFTVNFTGRESHGLIVQWTKDGILLQENIHTAFDDSAAQGSTVLSFPLARRSDAGVYHVRIINQVGVMGESPAFSSQQQVSFQLSITVRPTAPVNVAVEQITATSAFVRWELTDHTPDQAADQLIVRVTFANKSLADEIRLPGSLSSTSLERLVPANDYNLVVTATNRDGEATTNLVPFRTVEGAPAISRLDIQRVNSTGFRMNIQLMYTGGGAISTLSVSYWPTADPTAERTFPLILPETNGGLEVTATFDLAEPEVATELIAGELQLTITVNNEFNFNSPPYTHHVPPYTYSPPTSTVPSVSELNKTELLPLWLIAVIVCVVTVLIMLLLVSLVVFICVKCDLLPRRKKTVNPSNTHTSSLESGSEPSVTNPVDQYQAEIENRSKTSREEYHSRSQLSVRSVGYTPTLDEHEQHMGRKHKRELSECSSVVMGSKMAITPSTTASNSPINCPKNNLMVSLDKLDKLDRIAETTRSDDDSGTESERDRFRQQEHHHKLNMINSSRLARGHADGSVCGSSHHSLVSSVGGHIIPQHHQPTSLVSNVGGRIISPQQQPLVSNVGGHIIPPQQQPPRIRADVEYGYSDGESVASTAASYSNLSAMPSNLSLHQKHFIPVQYRSPTPYNHEYNQPEEVVYRQAEEIHPEESMV